MNLTSLMVLVLFGLIGAAMLAVVVLVVVLVVRGGRAAPLPPGAPLRWNVMVFGSDPIGRLGGTLGADVGTLEIRDGHLGYHADGAAEPAWRVPCAGLPVRLETGLRGLRTLTIHAPTGPMHVAVSRERLDRVVDNPLKDLREAGYAAELHRVLTAHGARPW